MAKRKFNLTSTDSKWVKDPLKIIAADGHTMTAEEIRAMANHSVSGKSKAERAAIKAARDWYNQTAYKTKLNQQQGKKYDKKSGHLIDLSTGAPVAAKAKTSSKGIPKGGSVVSSTGQKAPKGMYFDSMGRLYTIPSKVKTSTAKQTKLAPPMGKGKAVRTRGGSQGAATLPKVGTPEYVKALDEAAMNKASIAAEGLPQPKPQSKSIASQFGSNTVKDLAAIGKAATAPDRVLKSTSDWLSGQKSAPVATRATLPQKSTPQAKVNRKAVKSRKKGSSIGGGR